MYWVDSPVQPVHLQQQSYPQGMNQQPTQQQGYYPQGMNLQYPQQQGYPQVINQQQQPQGYFNPSSQQQPMNYAPQMQQQQQPYYGSPQMQQPYTNSQPQWTSISPQQQGPMIYNGQYPGSSQPQYGAQPGQTNLGDPYMNMLMNYGMTMPIQPPSQSQQTQQQLPLMMTQPMQPAQTQQQGQPVQSVQTQPVSQSVISPCSLITNSANTILSNVNSIDNSLSSLNTQDASLLKDKIKPAASALVNDATSSNWSSFQQDLNSLQTLMSQITGNYGQVMNVNTNQQQGQYKDQQQGYYPQNYNQQQQQPYGYPPQQQYPQQQAYPQNLNQQAYPQGMMNQNQQYPYGAGGSYSPMSNPYSQQMPYGQQMPNQNQAGNGGYPSQQQQNSQSVPQNMNQPNTQQTTPTLQQTTTPNTTNPPNSSPTTETQKPKGVCSLSIGSSLSQSGKSEKDKTEQALLGDEVTVLFQLDAQGGAVKKHTVNMGRPIEWLKLLVEREHGINFEAQKMFVGSKELANFLSLQDVPEIKTGSENLIVVKEV